MAKCVNVASLNTIADDDDYIYKLQQKASLWIYLNILASTFKCPYQVLSSSTMYNMYIYVIGAHKIFHGLAILSGSALDITHTGMKPSQYSVHQ